MAGFEPPPSDNLYMKGLPLGMDEESLRKTFGAYGTVTSCKVLACPPGCSDSAALVRMSSVPEAQWIVEQAQNIAAALGTSSLLCKFATKGGGKGDKGGDKGFGAGKGAMQPYAPSAPSAPGARGASNRLYMKGFPAGISEEDMKQIMGAYGTIVSCKVLSAPPGAPDTACIMQFQTVEEAQWLVDNLDTNIPQGLTNPVTIKFKEDSGKGDSKGGGPIAQVPISAQTTPPLGITVTPPVGGPCESLVITGLPSGFNENAVYEVLGVYGTITSCSVQPGPGSTTVRMRLATLEEATWLVNNLNGNIPQGLSTPVGVSYDSGSKGKGKKGSPIDLRGNQQWVPTAPAWQAAPAPSAPSWAWGGDKGKGWDQGGKGFAKGKGYDHGWDKGGKGFDKGKGFEKGGGDQPSDNLYIKGLPLGTTEDTMRQIFGAYGEVLSCKVLNSPPGVPDAAALLRLGSIKEAAWLVEHVNGNIPEGLGVPVQIKFASNNKGSGKSAPDAGWSGAASSGPAWNAGPSSYGSDKGGGKNPPSDNLYMKGFDANISEDGLRQIMSPYGNIISCKVLPPPPGKDCAACLVRMGNVEEASWLVEHMNGNIPQGMSTPVEVKFAANSTKGGGKGKDGGKGFAPY